MTWWENQQSWHDMANMVFQSPATGNWLGTISMTLFHVRPNDEDFDLRTLAQSGEEVLELGILAYPAGSAAEFETALDSYLIGAEASGASNTFTFDFFSDGAINVPLTTAYNANGPATADGSEAWKVYMIEWDSLEDYEDVSSSGDGLLEDLKATTLEEHSSIDVTTRSTSKVCCTKTGQCLLDPEECNVGVLDFQDTWALSCARCRKPCVTDYDICSLLSTKTCLDIGGKVESTCDAERVNEESKLGEGNGESSSGSLASGFSFVTVTVAAVGAWFLVV
jgi:hypothetical protein